MGVAPAVELEPGLPEPPGVVRHGAGHLVGQERHQAGDGQGDQDLHQGGPAASSRRLLVRPVYHRDQQLLGTRLRLT